MVQTSYHMCVSVHHCAKFEVIWTMLSRWSINGREVANIYSGVDVYRRRSTHISRIPQLWELGWRYGNIVSSSLLLSWTIIDTLMMPYISEVSFKRFEQFWISYEFWKLWSTTVDQSLCIVYFRLVQMVFFGHSVKCHHTIPFLHDAKRDFGRWCTHACFTNGTIYKLDLSFCMIFLRISKQIGMACMVQTSYHMCVSVHPCAKFEVIWTIAGELY